MATYQLLTSSFTVASSNGSPQNPMVNPYQCGGLANQSAAIQLSVSGPMASATIQAYGSNDGVNVVQLGDPVTVTSTTSQTVVSTTPYTYYGAQITAISGTGAIASALLSC